MKVTVYNLKRESVGELDLSDEVFGAEVKEQLFYEVVKAQLASRRAGTKATKERSAVAGSTKKLYRQKGTGRARQGSIRAPHHAGGGHAHALEPKDWSYRPPRKVRIGALKSALSLFAKEGRLTVIDSLELPEIKTKALVSTLGTLQAGKKSLVVDSPTNDKLVRSIRNLEDHHFLPPEGVNVYDLLRHDHLVVSREAAKALEARCLR
ncbi:MAG: 50S ribosomal protein L4 [Polyangiaceae bacterium]|nr:50S ribosomal protein L4 [Polyangiaceae bacterium]NUQ79119.1 50S ribosomal protein L4 [Polyangiaceae bacterium]